MWALTYYTSVVQNTVNSLLLYCEYTLHLQTSAPLEPLDHRDHKSPDDLRHFDNRFQVFNEIDRKFYFHPQIWIFSSFLCLLSY